MRFARWVDGVQGEGGGLAARPKRSEDVSFARRERERDPWAEIILPNGARSRFWESQ